MNFLKLSYWFESSLPTPFIPEAFKVLIGIFAGFVVLGVALHIIARSKKENLYWRDGIAHLAVAIFQTGIIGAILVAVVQEQIQFFGMRVWLLVLAVWFLVRVILVVRKMLTVLPKQAAVVAERARINKYLP